MKNLFSLRASIFWRLLAVLALCLAPTSQIQGNEPPVNEKAVRALLEAKDLESLDRLFPNTAQGDEALKAVYLTRRLALSNTRAEELRFLESLPDSEKKLWRVYQLTYPSSSGLGEDSRVGNVVYGMFERAARLARKHGSGHRRVLRLCLFSDGELADIAWDWCGWLVTNDPQRALNAIRTLSVEDQRRMCGDANIEKLTAKEVVEKCVSDL